jgi:DnaK suppressor protein
MTRDQVARLKMMLESRLSSIQETIVTLQEDLLEAAATRPMILQNGSDHAKEEGDINARIEIHELNISARDQLRAALLRLGKGTYGICLKCGEAICVLRLEAQLDAVRCVQCQMIEEKLPIIKKSRFAFIHRFAHWTLGEAV